MGGSRRTLAVSFADIYFCRNVHCEFVVSTQPIGVRSRGSRDFAHKKFLCTRTDDSFLSWKRARVDKGESEIFRSN